MFGIFRFILSIFVVLNHLTPIPEHTFFNKIGVYAVYGFFVLSGYLMTYILNHTYGKTIQGVGRYLINRFLRIYPTYYITVLLAVLCIASVGPDVAATYHGNLIYPESIRDYLSNLLIFGLIPLGLFPNSSRLVPPAWALDVELSFYIFIALFLGRNKRNATRGLVFSILLIPILQILQYLIPLSWTYTFWGSALLPFSIGCCIYYYQDDFDYIKEIATHQIKSIIVLVSLSILFILNYAIALSTNIVVNTISWYLNTVLMALIIIFLTYIPKGKSTANELDKYLGSLSYPIYLIHWHCGLLVSHFIFADKVSRGYQLLLLSLPLILSISHLLAIFLDRSIEKFRLQFK